MLFIKKKAKEAEMEKMKAVEVEQPKPETVKCPKCGASIRPHRVCSECGTYKGKEVITKEETTN